MHSLLKLLCVVPLFTLLACSTSKSNSEQGSIEPDEPKSYKVLYIGNSFTYFNSLDEVTENIAKSINIDMTCKRYAVASHSLLEDCDANDSLGKQIFADLKVNQYTDIVLQDKSNYPYNHYADFKNGVKGMKDKIVPLQKNAKIHLYETWGYNSENLTAPIPEMEATIKKNTDMVAKAYSLSVAYVGQAFTYVYENHKSINLYYSDNKHPSYTGTYLSALVHIATITGKRVSNVKYQGEKGKTNEQGQVTFVDEATRDILIDVAEKIVFSK